MRLLSVFPAACLLAPLALAQGGAPIEFELDAEAVTVIMPVADDAADREAVPLLGELSLNGLAERVLDNGVRLRARGALRLQYDHPQRPGGLGAFGTDMIAPTGAFSGLSSGAVELDGDLRARLETAYLQIDGGYGEVRVGKDQGVAARFNEGLLSVLSHARLDSALLDPTGLATVQTRHDLTGPSLKLSYASPRLLGVRAGLSFTPEADADGLDRRPAAGAAGIAPDLSDAIELALNASRTLRDSGFRLDIGLGWSRATVEDRAKLFPYSSAETWSAGSRISLDDWTAGASWLGSDNGATGGDYSAWSAGLHRTAYDTEFSVEYGKSEDDLAALTSEGWRLGMAREFGDSTRLAIAYLRDEIDTPVKTLSSDGIVVEITLSEEILKLTGN